MNIVNMVSYMVVVRSKLISFIDNENILFVCLVYLLEADSGHWWYTRLSFLGSGLLDSSRLVFDLKGTRNTKGNALRSSDVYLFA